LRGLRSRTRRLAGSLQGTKLFKLLELAQRCGVLIAAFPLQGTCRGSATTSEIAMGNLLHYAIVFLVVALVAAAVGFGGVAGFAMDAARLLFWVFIVLFVVSLVAGLMRRA
jgi:uncharacterized membrane protein YtjA (UPF0391 family)